MARELNPQLFGTEVSTGSTPRDESLSLFDQGWSDERAAELEARFDKLRFDLQEWMKSFNLRLDKVGQRMQYLEERVSLAIKDTHNRIQAAQSRFKENTMSDTKIAALVERHNQIVQSFELRITQSQRVIENQSVQLAKQQEMIDEARRQIEKLKKL